MILNRGDCERRTNQSGPLSVTFPPAAGRRGGATISVHVTGKGEYRSRLRVEKGNPARVGTTAITPTGNDQWEQVSRPDEEDVIFVWAIRWDCRVAATVEITVSTANTEQNQLFDVVVYRIG